MVSFLLRETRTLWFILKFLTSTEGNLEQAGAMLGYIWDIFASLQSQFSVRGNMDSALTCCGKERAQQEGEKSQMRGPGHRVRMPPRRLSGGLFKARPSGRRPSGHT